VSIRIATVLLVLAACNHEAPSAGQGSGSAQGSASVPDPSQDIADDPPPSATLPGAALPGGLRGQPKSGAATLADLGVQATWPDDLKVRWLSDSAVLVTVEKQPVMLAKVPIPSVPPEDGELLTHAEDNVTTVTCDRTLHNAQYHFEVRSPTELASRSLGALCKALR
jgi:hypothetical protein